MDGSLKAMNRILCSSGAIIGIPNNRDHTLLKEYAPRLNCDGFEVMMYSNWYPILDEVIKDINSYGLVTPVVHSQKSLGEALCGMTASYSEGCYSEHIRTPEEDVEAFREGTERFKLNLRLAQGLGAEKLVLHLWNGIASDKNINKNVERFGEWKSLAEMAGVELLVENVICNTHDPLYNVGLVAGNYEDSGFVYDTKMAEFHCQTMKLFEDEYEELVRSGRIKHLHVNDYGGGYMDWGNMRVLPVGAGHVDFDAFFSRLGAYGYNGDYTVEATALSKTGEVDFDMLNTCFDRIRDLHKSYIANK